jgi:hypothetical protein
MKSSFIALIVSPFFANLAFADNQPGPSHGRAEDLKAECFYNDSGEFVFKGEFGNDALICFKTKFQKETNTIRIDSEGGLAGIGLVVADILKDENFHLIIENRCNSSCALYLIPIAKEVTLQKNAGILLHGAPSRNQLKKAYKRQVIQAGLNRGLSKKEAKREYSQGKKYLTNQIAAGEEFKRTHNVRSGWFMQAGGWSADADMPPVEQDGVTWMQVNATNGILVDRLFFESCLPDVKINKFYGASHSNHLADPFFQARVKKANVSVLPDAICVD